jgi:hypothetical protein
MRWHWFGDCSSCNGYGCFYCNETGAGKEFHPHLNIFIDKKYISNLDLFLASYKRWVKIYVNRLLDKEVKKRIMLIEKYGDLVTKSDQAWKELDLLHSIQNKFTEGDLVINYSYTKKKSMMINKLKYVTRSTFRIYNKDVKETLHNYRNSVRWGFTKVKSCLNPIACDICKSKGIDNYVHWHKLNQYTNPLKVKHYENGIYRISEGGYNDNRPLTITPVRTGKLTARDFSELSSSHYSKKYSYPQ